jgi:hypothetical protein
MFMRWVTALSTLTTMPSIVVSLKPPLRPLVRGVRIASVMTTSSGFFWVLPSSDSTF